MSIQQLQQQLEFFRLTFADRPFWLFTAVFFSSLGLLALVYHARRTRERDEAEPLSGSSRAAVVTAGFALAAYVAIVLWYVWREQYYDYAEPTIAAVGWLFELGRPIYHDVESAERYAHMYGPLAFIIPGTVLSLAGPSILTSKIAGAGLLGLVSVHRLARSVTGRHNALLLTGLFAAIGLMYRNLSFWVRPDAFLLLFTSLALLAALRRNMEWAIFLLIPLAPTLLVRAPSLPGALPGTGRRWFYGSFLLGLALVVIAASKPGAGNYHLLPFWPIVIYAIALHIDTVEASLRTDLLYRAGRFAFAIVIFLIAGTQQVVFVSTMSTMDEAQGEADLERIVTENPGRSIAMGYAHRDERLTWVRPVLVFRTGQYLIDAPAVQEYQMSGLAFPEATVDAMRRCAVDLWLFPREATPFGGPNAYPITGYAPLFPERFKQVFFDHYEHARDTRYFQVWSCRQHAEN